MDLAHARSLLHPGVAVHVEPHRPDREADALHALACWALRYTPMSATDPPDGLMLDTSGTERVHKGETRMIRAAAEAVSRLGFTVRVAAASTYACAWAVARFGAHAVSRVPPGSERVAVADLPVAALKVDALTVQGMREIGVTRVAEVLALPRASVAPRFGGELLERIDQVLGQAIEYLEPVRPTPPARAAMLFDGPTDRWESVEAAARHVLEELTSELAQRERGVRRLDVEIVRPYAVSDHLRILLSRPSRNFRHLWTLVRSRLERVDLGRGVEGLVLVATRTGRMRHEQAVNASMGGSGDQTTLRAWGELIDALAGRLGADGVARVEPVESHLPERAFRVRSAMEEPARSVPPSITSGDRPTRLFSQPEPAEVIALTPDGPVMSLGWRGELYRVITCTGPERLAAEWWNWQPDSNGQPRSRSSAPTHTPPPDRDYFAAQVESGRWLWVCRQVGTGRWFVHGEWS